MELKIPGGQFRTNRELEELTVAKQFGILPEVWDEMVLKERERLIGAARDQSDMERIALMDDKEKDGLGAVGGWVKVKGRDNGR